MARRNDNLIWKRLLSDVEGSSRSLQIQIREMLVLAISEGLLKPGDAIPSSRGMAATLGLARNTIVAAYEQLVDQDVLLSRERSGYFVSWSFHAKPNSRAIAAQEKPLKSSGLCWDTRLKMWPSSQRNIRKPADWQSYPFPFLYGQFDQTLFPTADWRECGRQALSQLDILDWAPDVVDADDPKLIEQLRTNVLPRRGIVAEADEIVITVGAQQALFLLADLLTNERSVVGIEDPGYPDGRNIFQLRGRTVRPLSTDESGLRTGRDLRGCDLVLTTPSHQCPTTRIMPLHRREALLDDARRYDFVIVEDDYDSEIAAFGGGTPALKSLDRHDRVIYVSSFSKVLAPGLRLGFVVAPASLAREIRALRRLMVRHPALNNQRTVALFLSLGHYGNSMRRRADYLQERAQVLSQALARHLPSFEFSCDPGASNAWVKCPEWIDVPSLADRAAERGVLLEPGDVFFADTSPHSYLRLGFSSICADRIEKGIERLATVVREQSPRSRLKRTSAVVAGASDRA